MAGLAILKRFTCHVALLLVTLTPSLNLAADLSKMHPEVEVEIRSYGESPWALTDLLATFFATRNFGFDRPNGTSDDGLFFAVFSNIAWDDPAHRDALLITGKFNCIAVTYYSMTYYSALRRRTYTDPKGLDRASDLMVALKEFLRGLPTPRLEVNDIKIDSKLACGNPTEIASMDRGVRP
jgi:hypothetical protein